MELLRQRDFLPLFFGPGGSRLGAGPYTPRRGWPAPARNAIVPQIAPPGRLLEANGLLQVSFRAAFFVGPLLLAPLLAVFSLELVLALDVITFLTSAATLAAIRVRPTAQSGEPIGLR